MGSACLRGLIRKNPRAGASRLLDACGELEAGVEAEEDLCASPVAVGWRKKENRVHSDQKTGAFDQMNEPNPLRPERSLDLTRPAALARVAPALVLLVLSPIVAEFLLGDFSVRQIGLLFAFIPQYGGGALLVRESARRAGKGWPSIILLALAYALIEEGFTTQSLFNPNYAGERLLDYGFIPAFGTSLNWAVFVLTIHVVWSIGSCIVIAEALAAVRWSTPWLGRLGYTLTALLFL